MAEKNPADSPVGLLLEAVNFAAIKHSTQRRKDVEKTPYINHPIGVAHILWKEGGVTDLATLQVGSYNIYIVYFSPVLHLPYELYSVLYSKTYRRSRYRKVCL